MMHKPSLLYRAVAAGIMLGGSAAGFAGCTSQPTEIVSGVTTQLQVPKFLQSVGVVVQLGGRLVFCESYDVVDGTVTHAVRKRPSAGEIRTQVEFGAAYTAEKADADAVGLAEWLVEATGHDLLYARVDLLADDDGTWMLGELEAVEPALYFAWADGSQERFADALLRRITTTT